MNALYTFGTTLSVFSGTTVYPAVPAVHEPIAGLASEEGNVRLLAFDFLMHLKLDILIQLCLVYKITSLTHPY